MTLSIISSDIVCIKDCFKTPVFHVNHWLNGYLSGVTDASLPYLHGEHAISHGTEIMLMSIAGIGAIAAIFFAWSMYVKRRTLPTDENALTGFEKLVYHKFYVDELYEKFISQPLMKMSTWLGEFFDRKILDRTVNGFAYLTNTGGKALKLFQTGNTGFYVFAMVIGMIVLFIIRLLI